MKNLLRRIYYAFRRVHMVVVGPNEYTWKRLLKSGRVVALERTSELLKAASSNVLRFKMDSALPAEFEDKARVTGRIVQLPAHDAHEIEEDVEVRKADLEDVFLDVMAKHGEQVAA